MNENLFKVKIIVLNSTT